MADLSKMTPEQRADAERQYKEFLASKRPKIENIFGPIGAVGDMPDQGTGEGSNPENVEAVKDFMWEQGVPMAAGVALAPFTGGMSIPAQAAIGAVGGEAADFVADYLRGKTETFGQRAMDIGLGTAGGTIFGAGGRALEGQPLLGKIKPMGAAEVATAKYIDRTKPGFFNKSSDKIIKSGNLPLEGQAKLTSLRERFQNPQAFNEQAVKDVFDVPKFNSPSESAYALELQEAIPEILDSNIITHTGEFNPITLKYEQPFSGNMVSEFDPRTGKPKINVTPSKDNKQVLNDVIAAKKVLIDSKHIVISDLDNAWLQLNKALPDGKKLTGINFQQDILPQLRIGVQSLEEAKPLIALIKQRQMLPSSAGIGDEMQKVVAEMETAMAQINGDPSLSFSTPLLNKPFAPGQATPLGQGQLGITEANKLLENINAVRRGLKAFDRAVATGQLQGVESAKMVNNGAANEAWKVVSESLRNAIDNQSQKTLWALRDAVNNGQLPMAPEFQKMLQNYTPNLVGKMNKKYGAFTDIEDAFVDQNLDFVRQGKSNMGRSLIDEVSTSDIPTTMTGAAVKGVQAGINKLRGAPSTLAQKELGQDVNRGSVKNLIDLMTIRVTPPVSRDFYKTMQNRDMLAQMLSRAAMMGIYAGDEFMFKNLPEPAQKQIHEQTIINNPDIAEDNEGYKSLVNGKIIFPEEQQMHNEKANAAPLSQRIKAKEGLINGGRYVPINPTDSVQIKPNAEEVDYMQRALGSTIEPEFSVMSRKTETEDMLSHMYRAMNMVDASRSGDKF